VTKFCWVKGPVFLESASPATGNTTEVSTESAGALSGVKTASASPVAEPRLKVELPGVTAAKGPGSEIGAIRSVMLGAGGASSSDLTSAAGESGFDLSASVGWSSSFALALDCNTIGVIVEVGLVDSLPEFLFFVFWTFFSDFFVDFFLEDR